MDKDSRPRVNEGPPSKRQSLGATSPAAPSVLASNALLRLSGIGGASFLSGPKGQGETSMMFAVGRSFPCADRATMLRILRSATGWTKKSYNGAKTQKIGLASRLRLSDSNTRSLGCSFPRKDTVISNVARRPSIASSSCDQIPSQRDWYVAKASSSS